MIVKFTQQIYLFLLVLIKINLQDIKALAVKETCSGETLCVCVCVCVRSPK